MKTALILGAAGQAGSYLADILLAEGYKVIGLVRRTSTTESLWRIQHVLDHPNFVLELGDITDPASIFFLCSKYRPDEVYNTAAQSHVHVSFGQPGLTWDVTAKGCLNVLEVLRSLYSPDYRPRFVQFSSSEMWGSNYSIDEQGEKYQGWDTPFKPNSPYAIAKLAAHNLTRIYRETYNMYCVSAILFNYESPRRGENFVTRKITKWIANLKYLRENGLDGSPIELGNIHSYRDWGYAKDYMTAVHKMLQQDSPQDYVVCTGKTTSVKDFLYKALAHIGITENPEEYYEVSPELFRPLEVPYLRGDNTDLFKKLNWQPTTTVDDLVKVMVDNEKV